MSIYLCKKYEEINEEEFLFNEMCVAYEIGYHVEAYMSLQGKEGYVRPFETYFLPDQQVENSAKKIGIYETDVNNTTHSIVFGYYSGIRGSLKYTSRDPYAARRYVIGPVDAVFGGVFVAMYYAGRGVLSALTN